MNAAGDSLGPREATSGRNVVQVHISMPLPSPSYALSKPHAFDIVLRVAPGSMPEDDEHRQIEG